MRPRTSSPIAASTLALLGIAALAACSSAPTQVGESTGDTHEAITNGTPVTTPILGSVMMWACPNGAGNCCPNNEATCTWHDSTASGGCSGTMIADRWMLTAHHCVTNEEVMTGGTPTPAWQIRVMSPDGASWAAGEQVFLHPSVDVALVLLGSAVVNSFGVEHTTPIWTGNMSGLAGGTVYCEGFGATDFGGNGFGTLRSANLSVNTIGGGQLYLNENASQQVDYLGDSGAACFLYQPGVVIPDAIVAVQSLVFQSTSTQWVDRLVGADAFVSWAATTINQDACSEFGAQCGTVTDANGKSASCGSCGAGDVCQSHQCVCAPQQCKLPTKWNQGDCACEIPCNSPRTCCIQAGGYWDGKYCE
jgi:hypothetical protein